MRFFRRFTSPLFLAALLASGSAAAQVTPEQEANARFQAGLRYYDTREFESARLAFTQAYAVLPKPGILINLALSELYANRPLEAITHLEQYLADPTAPPEKRDRAQRALEEAAKRTVTLTIQSSPGAEVKVDGRTPSGPVVHLMPGSHVFEARSGEKTKTASLELSAGEKKDVDLTFDGPAPTTKPVGPLTETPPPPIEKDEGSFWGIRSIGGLALFAGGGVMLAAGLSAKSTESDSHDKVAALGQGLDKSACTRVPQPAVCSDLARAGDDEASAKARGQTLVPLGIGVAVVGGLLFGSAFIWKHKSFVGTLVKPQIAPGFARLDLTTTF